jgi:HSP20 family molecular chaperone IbpA
MTISLSTYRTPTTNTLDSLFDSLFDPFFESVTIPRKRTASTVNTKVTTEDNKHIISVAAPGLDKEDFNITVTEGTLTVQTNKDRYRVRNLCLHKDLDSTRRHNHRQDISRLQSRNLESNGRKTRSYCNPETVTIKVS